MFLIRQSKPEDVSTLLKLARTVYFINLPPNEQLIAAKIEQSAACFRRVAGLADPAKVKRRPKHAPVGGYDFDTDLFMFSIVDRESGQVVGTSQLVSHMGGKGNPNWGMRVSEKKFHSESLRFGTTHTVAQLFGDESGPTEVGGLILDPGFRGHRRRPGRFISFVRFHFIGLERKAFADRVLAEMMGPITSEGDNLFWDAFGRKFIPVKYAEADRFCQHNRQFISELLPKDEIYLTLLPLEVINSVGVVPRETQPARRLLENLGFRYHNVIDCFDGGPHLDAPTDEIPLVSATKRLPGRVAEVAACTTAAIVSVLSRDGDYRAIETWVELAADSVGLAPDDFEALEADAGATLGVTPLGIFGSSPADANGENRREQQVRP